MWINSVRVVGIRCFEDTGDIRLSRKCNVFIGQNNSGKSTLLKTVLSLQGFPFDVHDFRPNATGIYWSMHLRDIAADDELRGRSPGAWKQVHIFRGWKGRPAPVEGIQNWEAEDNGIFASQRPKHTITPFLARRKAAQFDHSVASGVQSAVTGTLSNLFSRIDSVATAGHPRHRDFMAAVEEVIGIPITTKASVNGKEAGFYLTEQRFVTLDRMGDGVTEMVALIVELCLDRGKIFVLEEPETNIHPSGLKALLALIRRASEENQFIIATHSNIVLRELGADRANSLFRVSKADRSPLSPSLVESVPQTPSGHISVLRELGYEFGDLGLHAAWLFLEEASAETIFNEVLVPRFVPSLSGRVRTFSAGGVSNLEPSIRDFQRLITFVHLQPAYEGRLWVRTDGDDAGSQTVSKLISIFPYLNSNTCRPFKEPAFECYYPERFQSEVSQALAVPDKQRRRIEKSTLLQKVLAWTAENQVEATSEWGRSAAEPIALLKVIERDLGS